MNQPRQPKIFCQFRTPGMGFCGMYLKPGEEVCERHKGKVSKKKIATPRFRGSSDFQRETLGYKSNKE